ncbi:MAG: signal recognition particle protein [Alphaproteobacteria bacterium]|jgi:signal recognition particle subunit SRP54
MFESLSSRLGDVFEKLKRRGALSEGDVTTALRDVRVALLEADVALSVVKQFIEQVKERALGAEVLKSITPGQMVVKIVHDHLTEMLGSEAQALNFATSPPSAIMMVGLQGSGKTTTTAKLALYLTNSHKKKVLMASLDVHRPAAQEQLAVLGREAGVETLPVVIIEQPLAIAKRAMTTARREGYDVVLLDTAGRLHIDDELMNEAASVRDIANPAEVLLVADALTGQDAVTLASAFNERVGISGIVLTRVDGDGRGGAALSMRNVTGKPIKLIGVGEKLADLEVFHPDRIASRILGMGDVISLVEKVSDSIDQEDAEKLAKKMIKGGFDFNDLATQLGQMRKMGGMEGILGMLPGVSKAQRQMAEANIDENLLIRQQAIIGSMTKAERLNAKLLNGSRKRRIAGGSGTTVQDVNRVLKQFKQISMMMKRAGKLGKKRLLRGGMQSMLPPGMGGGFPGA